MRRQGATNPEPAQGTSIAALALVRTGAAGSAVAIRMPSGIRASETEIGKLMGQQMGQQTSRIPADPGRSRSRENRLKPCHTVPSRLTGSGS
jgi:hypothetical protein